MNFVPKDESRRIIKKLLKERQMRSDAEEAKRRRNYVCVIKEE